MVHQLRNGLGFNWLGLGLTADWVRFLFWENPTCHGATRPEIRNYWACASRACALQHWTCELFISKSCSTSKGMWLNLEGRAWEIIPTSWHNIVTLVLYFSKRKCVPWFLSLSFFFSSLLPSLSLFLPFFIVFLPSFLFHTKEIQNFLLEE